ncbi:MAG TPA: hypothetical protein VEK86_10120 [Gemmatimonadales bacterium]|nr:hypothetical protein [Gemmatimonadales bacterium]
MLTVTRRIQATAQPYKPFTDEPSEDEAFTTDEAFAVKQKMARPAHWIPGSGALPADFFLPGLA